MHRKNKAVSVFFFVLLFPYILIHSLCRFTYEKLTAPKVIRDVLAKERTREFRYELAIVAIAKNEALYVREWIKYHLVASEGSVHFFLYDNDSEDGLEDVIRDFIDNGVVTYIPYPGNKMQLPAYDDAIAKYSGEARYMAFIDLDEFITSRQDVSITKQIRDLIEKNNACGLGLNWCLYGSSGEKKKRDGLLIERFQRHGTTGFWGNEHVKSIVNPRMVKRMISCHYPLYYAGGWNINTKGKRQHLWINKPVDWDILYISHFFCKSEEEFIKKKSRGFADRNGGYDMSNFNLYDVNDVSDDILLRYVNRM